jgi:outer membrane receptor protein involved in Fe transport
MPVLMVMIAAQLTWIPVVAVALPVRLPAAQTQNTNATTSAVSGIVRDGAGLPVAGATVVVRTPSGAELRAVSGTDGRFSIVTSTPGPVTVIVRASGFAEARQTVAAGATRADLAVVLSPASIAEAVTVTPTRSEQRMSETPASVNVIDRQQIRQSAAVVADDILRQAPTFSLFRRTSSLSSHPTAQGVSLRGIGPSGVSRTLVLLDGVPFNDPFGGWVYWTRIPIESTDRIEMVDGSTSSLYGNYAMGGVINVVTSQPTPRTVESRLQFGNLNTPRFDVRASDVYGKLGIVVEGSAFDTDGYPIVAAAERGAVDTKASVLFRNANVGLQYDLTDRVKANFRVGYFHEERDNGKVSTIDRTPEGNDTTWKTVSGGVRARLASGGDVQATLFGDVEDFHSNFLAVPTATPARSIGRMTLNQTVPTTGFGGMTQWSRAFGARHVLSAGIDWRQVKGESQEDGLDATFGTTVTLHRVSGGRQRSVGFFVQDILSVSSRLTLTLSARGDRWRNFDGHNLENNIPSGTPTANNQPSLADRDDTAVSPRAAALYHLTGRVSVWGSVGTGFRAPTLNELYRQFRVGTVLTLANNQLGPERLVGGEAGVRIEPIRHLTARVTWFDNQVKDPVSNVTLTTAGANVTQQRQNLGRTEIWGVQQDVEYRIGASWRVAAGYLYNHATVTENPSNTALVGKFLPQVPTHRGSVQVAYSNPRIADLSIDVEGLGSQFDDDQNTRVVPGYSTAGLPKYALVSFQASRSIGRNLEVFAGAQNLLNHVYFVGTLPTTIGTPRLVNAGVRVRVGGR